MPDSLSTDIFTSTIHWPDTRDRRFLGALPQFDETLLNAYRSVQEAAGNRALLAVGIRELGSDRDDPAFSEQSIERSALEFVQQLDAGVGPSDHGLALATRYLAFNDGDPSAYLYHLALATSLVSSLDFGDWLQSWRSECEEWIMVRGPEYQAVNDPHEAREAELLGMFGPYVREYALGTVIPALSRYFAHERLVVGGLASLPAGELAAILLEAQTTFFIEDEDIRVDTRQLLIDAVLSGCRFDAVDLLLEYLFRKTMGQDDRAEAFVASVQSEDEEQEPYFFG
jgi:hypothetical protein